MCVGGVCVCMPALTPRPSSPIDASCTALPRRPAATLGPRDAAGPCCSACRALWCGACRGAGRAACWRGVGGQGAALHRRLLVSGRGGCSMRRCPPGLPACARGIGSPAPCSLFWGALLGAGGMGGGPARLWGQGWLPTGGHRGWHRHPHPTAVETDIPPPLAAAFCRDMLEQAPAAMGQMVAAAALSARLPFRQVSAPGPPRARPPPCAPCPPPAACPLARAAVPPPGQRVRYLWPGCLPLPPTLLDAFQFTTAAWGGGGARPAGAPPGGGAGPGPPPPRAPGGGGAGGGAGRGGRPPPTGGGRVCVCVCVLGFFFGRGGAVGEGGGVGGRRASLRGGDRARFSQRPSLTWRDGLERGRPCGVHAQRVEGREDDAEVEQGDAGEDDVERREGEQQEDVHSSCRAPRVSGFEVGLALVCCLLMERRSGT